MSSPSGSFHLGPDSATLTVRTGTAGAMAKAGHNLEIQVASWSAELTLGASGGGSLSLDVDSASLKVIDGHGGPKALTDDDRVKIAGTINDKILKRSTISFRSDAVEADSAGHFGVRGELTLRGATRPVLFELTIDDRGRLQASAKVVQSEFGIEPYSAMMGALKVSDELVIEVAGELPPPTQS